MSPEIVDFIGFRRHCSDLARKHVDVTRIHATVRLAIRQWSSRSEFCLAVIERSHDISLELVHSLIKSLQALSMTCYAGVVVGDLLLKTNELISVNSRRLSMVVMVMMCIVWSMMVVR